jgi:hypothetical protein
VHSPGIPQEFPRNSPGIPKEFPRNSPGIPQEFLEGIPQEFLEIVFEIWGFRRNVGFFSAGTNIKRNTEVAGTSKNTFRLYGTSFCLASTMVASARKKTVDKLK